MVNAESGTESNYDAVYKAGKLLEHEIRVICVAPRISDDAPEESQEIHCHLKQLSLDNERASKYTALSYTWGSKEPSYSIMLDGHRVRVRKNVADAIQMLRPKKGGPPLVIWIDAISINQKDEKEKSQQIKMMRRIFQQAETVHVWIGREFPGSHDAFQFVLNVHQCANGGLVELIREPGRRAQLEHLRQLFYKDYWWRIWVVQEVVVARRAVVYCGNDSVPWDVLHDVGDKLMEARDEIRMIYHETPDYVFKLLHRAGPKALKLPSQLDQKELPLLRLLQSHYSKFSTNPRDKVYGVVGISDARSEFEIDYAWSVEQVFTYTTRFVIQKGQNLDIICNPKRDGSTLSLPSWTPDWTRYDTHSNHREMGLYIRRGTDRWYAGGDNPAKVTFSSDGSIIYVEGTILDQVEILGPPLNLNEIGTQSSSPPEKAKAKLGATCETLLEYWRLYTQICGHDLAEQDLFERTVFGGSWPTEGEFEPKYRLQLLFSLCQQLLPEAVFTAPERLFVPEVDNKKNRENMGSALGLRMHGYRIVFGSTTKIVGLAPRRTQAGDIICVLVGCNFPVVLRRTQDHFVLVGEVYVDQYMRGEALIDPDTKLQTFEIR